MKTSLTDAVRELHHWVYHPTYESFEAKLYTLFCIADLENKAALQRAFPYEAQAFRLWELAGPADDLFGDFGLTTEPEEEVEDDIQQEEDNGP